MNINAALRRDGHRALRNHKYEIGPRGILLPAAGLFIAGHFETSIDQKPWHMHANIVPTEGLNNALSVWLDQGSQDSAHYIGLFTGNVTPAASWTAANVTANSTEFTAYDEATRQTWAKADPAAGVLSNNASPATFTMSTGGPFLIRGGFLVSASAKSATTGKLAAAARFDDDQTLSTGSELKVKYVITATST